MDVESGDCIAGFLIVIDGDGCRHAIRLSEVLCLSDTDACGTETMMILRGGDRVRVNEPLDQVIRWMS